MGSGSLSTCSHEFRWRNTRINVTERILCLHKKQIIDFEPKLFDIYHEKGKQKKKWNAVFISISE